MLPDAGVMQTQARRLISWHSDSVLFRRPDPDVTGRACALWAIPVLALALLLGAACSDEGDGQGGAADAGLDRTADTAGTPVDATADRAADAADAGATADSGTGGNDASADVAAVRLCDGSVGPRLVFLHHGGGPLPPIASFTLVYGFEFFVIDGTCRYWVSHGYLGGIRTGVLTTAQADKIAADLHVGAFARLKGTSTLAAPDASTRSLSDGTNAIHCTADCMFQAPSVPTPIEFQQAFQRLQAVVTGLFDEGMPAGLPIRVIATDPETATGPVVAWPLTWSPSEVLVPMYSSPAASSGRLITSDAELSALRQLRQPAAALNPGSLGGIRVRDTAGTVFEVFPRDEAPAKVIQALAAAFR